MPRSKNNASARKASHPEADQKDEVPSVPIKKDVTGMKVNKTSMEDTKEVSSTSNQGTRNQDTNDEQQEKEKKPKIKLPNFLAPQIDNFATYLGTVPNKIVAPRSHSFGRQVEQTRTPPGSRNRVKSLDREDKIEGSSLTFLSPRMCCAQNVGPLYQRTDPYQLGGIHSDEPDKALPDPDELELRAHSCLGKGAECQIV